MKRILDAAIPRAVHSERDKAFCPVYGFNKVIRRRSIIWRTAG